MSEFLFSTDQSAMSLLNLVNLVNLLKYQNRLHTKSCYYYPRVHASLRLYMYAYMDTNTLNRRKRDEIMFLLIIHCK